MRGEQLANDFLSNYVAYVSGTEVPTLFSRWAAITSIAALLGRKYYIKRGHFNVYSNMYVQLVGSPGTGKGLACKLMKELLVGAGYNTFAADSTTKAKFIQDLSTLKYDSQADSSSSILDTNLGFDKLDHLSSDASEVFILAPEFNNFIGYNNIDFISWLGDMWDYEGTYKHKVKSSEFIPLVNPTITMLGGNTQSTLIDCFPPNLMGQGFFSRLIFVYAAPSGKRITFPVPPPQDTKDYLIKRLIEIGELEGELVKSEEAYEALEHIYTKEKNRMEAKFEHYYSRRFTHLLKLCMVVCACKGTKEKRKLLELPDVVYAHTMLSYTEKFMGKALANFGKGKNNDVAAKILLLLTTEHKVFSAVEIWKEVHQELESTKDLGAILQGLLTADKIISVPTGFLGKRVVFDSEGGTSDSKYVNWGLLTEEERGVEL